MLAVGLVAGLAGCGSTDNPAAGPSSSHAKSRKAHAPAKSAQPGEQDVSDMVAAVSASRGASGLELRFALPTRPEVGQVMDLDVAVVPGAPLPENVSAAFQAVEGLEIVEGAQIDRVDKLVAGAPIRHVLKIRPTRDGIFAVNAVVSFISDSQDVSRAFSIPVIVGAGLPEQVAKGP